MSTTDTFLKSRAPKSAEVKTGQWHADFSTVKKYSDKNKIPLLAVWSNGDACSHCIRFERACMDSKFKNWAKTSGVAMWFGCSKDTSAEDKFEGKGFTFARDNKLTAYPFVRLYWPSGKVDICKPGDDWTGGKSATKVSQWASSLVKNLKNALKNYTPEEESQPPAPVPTPSDAVKEYKVRFNEKLTGAQINKILDSIDANEGYCPCQVKSEDTKCHCVSFRECSEYDKPCICNLYVKKPV